MVVAGAEELLSTSCLFSSYTLLLLLLFAPFLSIHLSHPVLLASSWCRPCLNPPRSPVPPCLCLPSQAGGMAVQCPSLEASVKGDGSKSSVALYPAARAHEQVLAGTVGMSGTAALHPPG